MEKTEKNYIWDFHFGGLTEAILSLLMFLLKMVLSKLVSENFNFAENLITTFLVQKFSIPKTVIRPHGPHIAIGAAAFFVGLIESRF